MNEEIVKTSAPGPVVQRRGLQGQEVQIGDNLSVSAQAQERAQIETAVMMAAMKPPRDLDTFRAVMMRTVEDPAIAESWFYRRPSGGRFLNPETNQWENEMIEGPSIRAAEVMMQAYGKLFVSSRHIYEDRERVLLAATVIDLEVINVESADMMIEKTVERKKPREGQEVIGERTTSTGGIVFRVLASPDEIRTKVGADRSRLKRNGILANIPRGIVDEIGLKVKAILANENAKDPNAGRKKVFDRFATIGVNPDQLKTHFGKLDPITPAKLDELTAVFNGIKEGQFTWEELVAMKKAQAEGEAPEAEGQPSKSGGKLHDKLLPKKKKTEESAQQTLTPDPPPPGA